MVHRGTNYILKRQDENCCNGTQYLILYSFSSKTYGYSKSFRFLKNYKTPLVCKIDITLLKVIIQKMLFLFYRMIIIMKIANFRLIFPQLPMCLFSKSFQSIEGYACFLL